MFKQFRTIDIVWDSINNRINEQVILVSEGGGGRIFSVQVLNRGQVVDLTGVNLTLVWETKGGHYHGNEEFEMADKDKGLYELTPTGELTDRVGNHTAWLQLSFEEEQPIESLPFDLVVKRGVNR